MNPSSEPWNSPEHIEYPYWPGIGEELEAVQESDAEVRALKRRPAMGTFAEVEQAEDHVKLIITAGQKVIYRLSPELAKEIGEDLFKKGCNVKGVA